MRPALLALLSLLLAASTVRGQSLIADDPAAPLRGWAPFWSRAEGAGQAVADPRVRFEGEPGVRIDHSGAKDWSLGRSESVPVAPGEIYRLAAWIKAGEKSRAALSVVLYDAKGGALNWSHGAVEARSPEWTRVESRFMIPPGAARIQPRLIGAGPATLWIARPSLERDPHSIRIDPKPAAPLVLKDDRLAVEVDPATAAFTIRDARSGTTWPQSPRASILVASAESTPGAIRLELVDPNSILRFRATLTLDPDRPEVVVDLAGEGPLASRLEFPHPTATAAGQTLILPVNEGMSYPVDDPELPEMEYHLFGGHGLCMAWWGVIDGPKGLMAIVETPDDATLRAPRVDGRLALAPLWDPQKGAFGPSRRMRYVPVADGGYVAMAKRYREHAKSIGLFKTLAEKRRDIPAIDQLVGATNVWCWDKDPVPIARELLDAGVDRVLWSNARSPEDIKTLNAMGVLAGRYDIYQDVMDPAVFPKLGGVHPDWTTAAWPDDLMIDARGDWIRGWEVEGKDGRMYPCGVLCDRQAPRYAVDRIGEELKTHAYKCRFLDTTTASPWRECYDPRHPATRSESRRSKMELLDVVHGRFGLVTGSETGHDASVPFVDYFEGMLSLGPYRVDDAGRDMARIIEDVPPQIAKFQTGSFYRLPLWELVYHECVVAHWYWGDYNNKLPAVWRRRDLLNALYGTPPMYMFTAQSWRAGRDRFVESYKTAARVARETGHSEMLSHEWLTPDHEVQRTRFANGVEVVVNFGDAPRTLDDGRTVPPLGLLIRP